MHIWAVSSDNNRLLKSVVIHCLPNHTHNYVDARSSCSLKVFDISRLWKRGLESVLSGLNVIALIAIHSYIHTYKYIYIYTFDIKHHEVWTYDEIPISVWICMKYIYAMDIHHYDVQTYRCMYTNPISVWYHMKHVAYVHWTITIAMCGPLHTNPFSVWNYMTYIYNGHSPLECANLCTKILSQYNIKHCIYAMDIHHYDGQSHAQKSNLSISYVIFMQWILTIMKCRLMHKSYLSLILHDMYIQWTFTIRMCKLMHTNSILSMILHEIYIYMHLTFTIMMYRLKHTTNLNTTSWYDFIRTSYSIAIHHYNNADLCTKILSQYGIMCHIYAMNIHHYIPHV